MEDYFLDRVKVYWDRNIKYGENFKNFTELINMVNAVIVFMSPEFKKKIEERKGGIYDEFTLMWARYSDQQQEDELIGHGRKYLSKSSRFEIIPILFSGNIYSSIPDELINLKALDLTHLRVIRARNGEFKLSRTDIRNYVPKIRDIASQILSSIIIDSDGYRSNYQQKFDDYFGDLKASWNRSIDGQNVTMTQFVKTISYKKIVNQHAYFALGRKGCGKSTLVQVVPLMLSEKYRSVIHIEANSFNLEALYGIYLDPQFRSDTSTIISRREAFEFTWQALFILCLMHEMALMDDSELQKKGGMEILTPIRHYFKELFKEGFYGTNHEEWGVRDYFGFCFNNMSAFVRDCIENAQNNPLLFYPDIQRRFRLENFLEFMFGKNTIEAFWSILRLVDWVFLITLDGFDAAFDDFRLTSIAAGNTANLRQRALFELDWLRTLLSVTISIKSSVSGNYLQKSLDFCIVVPQDRFLEVLTFERDSYRNWRRWFTIQWTGIELAILLRKRLEGISGFVSNKNLLPEDRLQEVLSCKQFKHIPQNIQFEFNGKNYEMPLFLYVLRYTTWRPREVLIFYAQILTMADSYSKWGNIEITAQAINNCVKSAVRMVIESEFLAELKSTVINFSDILLSFRKQKAELDYSELRNIVQQHVFKFATEDLSEDDLVAKVRFLYNIGFIGLKLSDEQEANLGHLHNYCFVFNEGMSIFADRYLSEEDLANYRYVIHPLFWDYLRIVTENIDLPLYYDWDYLHQAEAALLARQ
jgi:energy-coupling factor transporter ATP-binding protein EcfA2